MYFQYISNQMLRRQNAKKPQVYYIHCTLELKTEKTQGNIDTSYYCENFPTNASSFLNQNTIKYTRQEIHKATFDIKSKS